VWAQDATTDATTSTPLSYGTPVTGAIDNTTFTQNWKLSTASADRVQVRVERTDGNLIPSVSILDNAGSSVADSYGSDYTYAAAQIDNTTLPAAGDYTIQVGRDGADSGTTTGSYSLVVTPLGTASDNPNNQTVIGGVQSDTPLDSEITATHWQHLYIYTAQAADVIDVTATRTSGTLYPVVTILDANGNSLTTGYNYNSKADTNAYQLPSPGQYTIAVSRYNDQNGDTLGTYELTVHLIGAGEGNPLLQGAAGTVVYDQELDSAITPAQWYQDWQLTANAGDTITITATRTSDDLQPEISLLGGSGQEINHGYNDNTGATATINRYDLAGPGSYTVRVTRTQGQNGLSSGSYALTVALMATGKGDPKLDQPVGAITLDQPAQGEITNELWQNSWTFSSTDGGTIDVAVLRSGGTLVPRLEIRDRNNQPLTTAYHNDARDSAEITNYQLPGPGDYSIVVIRDGDQQGYTAGAYTLTISTPKQ